METEVILEQYEKMINFSQDDLVKRVLELEENIEIFKNYDLLLRIHKSLKQYSNKQSNLIYIGLMGHFSTGKSSLINSLLNLEGKDAREEGRHPTDKGITLITDQKNETAFIKLGHFGNIPVKIQTVENEFLDNIVLIDTPGSADTDPLIVTELMQDYLPICDLLLYLFNSTNPIDRNDSPFLISKQKNLALIETKYVFTRADDLRLDFDAPVSEENFNEIEASRFLSVAISRIEQTVPYINISEKDFFFIDNKKKFRISELKEFLLDFSSDNNLENQLKLHEHKLNFYRKTGYNICSSFLNHIDQKINTLKSYVEDAKKNILRYEDKVRITNNRLSQTWKNYQIEIQKISNRNIEDLEEPYRKNPPASIWSTEGFIKINENIFSELRVLDATVKSYLTQAVASSIAENRDVIKIFKEEIDKLNLDNYPILNFDIESVKVTKLENADNIIPGYVLIQFRRIESELIKTIEELYLKIKADNNSLNYRSKNSQPLAEMTQIVDSGQMGLDFDLDVHFDNVYLYRAGVFAEHVKEYITKLGIGNKLSELEHEFNDEFKMKTKNEARATIFPAYENLKLDFQSNIKTLRDQFEIVSKSISDIDLKGDKINGLVVDSIIGSSSIDLKNKLTENLTVKIRNQFLSIKQSIEEQINSKWEEFRIFRKRLLRSRGVNFLTYASISLGIVGLFWLFKLFHLQDNVTNNFLLGIATNILVPVALIITAFIKDKFPTNLKQLKSETKNEIIVAAHIYLEEKIKEISDSSNEKMIIDQHIRETIKNQITDIKKQDLSLKLESTYKVLLEIRSDEYEIRKKYVQEIRKIYSIFHSYFEYDDKKLDLISLDIKKAAIEPSFQFLESLEEELIDVRKKIQIINFV